MFYYLYKLGNSFCFIDCVDKKPLTVWITTTWKILKEKGIMSNISQWFVKAPIADPRMFLFPLLSKAALRGIYVAGILLSFLNFPCLTPFQCLREYYLPQRRIFRGLTPLLEKEMATYSSVLAWRIPGMGEPGGLLSVGSHRVRHN